MFINVDEPRALPSEIIHAWAIDKKNLKTKHSLPRFSLIPCPRFFLAWCFLCIRFTRYLTITPYYLLLGVELVTYYIRIIVLLDTYFLKAYCI